MYKKISIRPTWESGFSKNHKVQNVKVGSSNDKFTYLSLRIVKKNLNKITKFSTSLALKNNLKKIGKKNKPGTT